MKEHKFRKKDIRKICPKKTCLGNLRLLEKGKFGNNKYECCRCRISMFLDKNGCGTYE
jgi:hypothetical protein